MVKIIHLSLFLSCASCDGLNLGLNQGDESSSMADICKATAGRTEGEINKRNVARLDEVLKSKNLTVKSPAESSKWKPLQVKQYEGIALNGGRNADYFAELEIHTFEKHDPSGGDGYEEIKALSGKLHGESNGCRNGKKEIIVTELNGEIKYVKLNKKEKKINCSFKEDTVCNHGMYAPTQYLYELADLEKYAGTLDLDIEWEVLVE